MVADLGVRWKRSQLQNKWTMSKSKGLSGTMEGLVSAEIAGVTGVAATAGRVDTEVITIIQGRGMVTIITTKEGGRVMAKTGIAAGAKGGNKVKMAKMITGEIIEVNNEKVLLQ